MLTIDFIKLTSFHTLDAARVPVQSLERRQFMNWEAMLVCGAKRAMGNSSDDRLLDDSAAGRSPWVHGWADVLDIVNSHAQVPAPPNFTR